MSTLSFSPPLQVAILGARGIGKLHAQTFHGLGATICAVLGSTERTAALAARDLARDFGIQARAFSRLKELLLMPDLDAVSICTPPHLHFEQTLAVLDNTLPVFCEKPLFWHPGITRPEIARQLQRLASHPHRRLFMNSSNADLIDRVRARLPQPHDIESFFFQYYTQGPYRGRAIAADLLPHGYSLLLRLLGKRHVDKRSLHETITFHTYSCQFQYGNCRVTFDFREQIDGPRAFVFSANDQTFTRLQMGSGATYRLFLDDRERGERVEVEPPFRNAISHFLHVCRTSPESGIDAFEDAADNMRLMAHTLVS